MKLYANNRTLDLSHARIMGILNFTPDSFSDSGKFFQKDTALFQAEKMIRAGAAIIDIGGESTRPGASEVSVGQELDRVVPLVEAVRKNFDCWISVDSSKAEVIRESAKAGMDIINDIRALSEPQTLQSAVQLQLPVCIMHMQGQPRTMQSNPQYADVVEDVLHWLQKRAELCLEAGVKKENLILDPGFGFGKTVEHNYRLLKHLDQICQLGYPVLAGLSRKSMIGAVLDKPVDQRISGSVAGALLCAMRGARIIRVHDVEETMDALRIWLAAEQVA